MSESREKEIRKLAEDWLRYESQPGYYDGEQIEETDVIARALLVALDEAEAAKKALRWIADRQDDSRKPYEIAREALSGAATGSEEA